MFLKSFISLFLKTQIFGVCLIFCFLLSYFYILLSAASLYYPNLAAVRYIPELESEFFLVVISFCNLTLFCCSIIINSILVSWIWMMVSCLTESYAAAQSEMLLDDFWLTLSRRKTIGSPVLVSCTSIGTTVWHDLSLISLALVTEDTWTEAENAWVFVF